MKYAPFKYDIGYVVKSYDRNIMIIDCQYRSVIKHKNGKNYTRNEKWYQYMCLDCGNEDWIYEYCLGDKMHIGCNVCCSNSRKVIKGINDVSTTAPWMLKYFADKQDAYTNTKYSRKTVQMICPDCGREYRKQIMLVAANKGLACTCGDGWSYPNKFMYALLEQIGVDFEPEKRFSWSQNRVYDDYIEYNGIRIITEQHGNQHYNKAFGNTTRHRSVEEEKENDNLKYELALKNGIDYYFVINSSISTKDYIRNSIVSSGLLDVLDAVESNIDWDKCNEFATSNLAKTVCLFKNENPSITLRQIADNFKISYKSVLEYIKTGNDIGWCNYNFDDAKLSYNFRTANQKPIFCKSNGTFYRHSKIACNSLSTSDTVLYPRQLRGSIERGQRYKGLEFCFISQKEFNKKKIESPDKVVGDFFILGENND